MDGCVTWLPPCTRKQHGPPSSNGPVSPDFRVKTRFFLPCHGRYMFLRQSNRVFKFVAGAVSVGVAGGMAGPALSTAACSSSSSTASRVTELEARLAALEKQQTTVLQHRVSNLRGHVPPSPASSSTPEKVCLITGAGSGIGQNAAIALAEAGYHVVSAQPPPTIAEWSTLNPCTLPLTDSPLTDRCSLGGGERLSRQLRTRSAQRLRASARCWSKLTSVRARACSVATRA
jgi:hypothetical protein